MRAVPAARRPPATGCCAPKMTTAVVVGVFALSSTSSALFTSNRLQTARRQTTYPRPNAKRPLPKHGGAVSMILGDYKDTSKAQWDEDPHSRPPELDHSSLDVHDLLLQRALQTQSRYFRETRNDLQADWMLGFLNHEHLGSGDKWHSVIGMRVHFTDYFRGLLAEPEHAFTVSVKQGVTEGKFSDDATPTNADIKALERSALAEDAVKEAEEAKLTLVLASAGRSALGLATVIERNEEEEARKRDWSPMKVGASEARREPRVDSMPYAKPKGLKEEEKPIARASTGRAPRGMATIARAPGATSRRPEAKDFGEKEREPPQFDGEGDVKMGLENAAGVAEQKAGAQGELLDSMNSLAGTENDGAGAPRTPMTVHPDLVDNMWSKAAESRRRNPFLQEERSIEYTDYVQPREVAATIMRVCRVLSAEWLEDLAIIAREDNTGTRDERKTAAQKRRKYCKEHPDDEECLLDYGDQLDTPAFEQAERARDSESTPLRRLNFELLQRSTTILGIKSLQTELAFGAMTVGKKSQELIWFDAFVESWWPQLAGVEKSVARGDGSDIALDAVSDRLFQALELSMPVILKGNLVDPQSLAEQLHVHRERSALQLARQLEDTDSILENLVIDAEARIMLERAM